MNWERWAQPCCGVRPSGVPNLYLLLTRWVTVIWDKGLTFLSLGFYKGTENVNP